MDIYNKAVSLLTSSDKFHIKLGLERVSKLLNHFDSPQDKIKSIHVAGTNGKGSTCAMIANILKEAGYKTALYTSPHLVEYTERIRVNNCQISREDFAKLVFEVVDFAQKANIPATEFEIITVVGFIYFSRRNVDFALIETGLGGRLDATNTINSPEASIITDIDLDHTARLGNTVEKIASEKAGIIKKGRPVITLNDNNGLNVIKQTASEKKSVLRLAFPKNQTSTIPQGVWHERNLSLVKNAISLLRENGYFISEKDEKNGIKNTVWTARFQYFEKENLIIDSAHNPAAASALRKTLDKYFPDSDRIFIYSTLNTKDYHNAAKILFRKNDRIILTKSSSFACVEPNEIKKFINNNVLDVYVTENSSEAMKICNEIKTAKNLIVFTGSIYAIGEYLSSFNNFLNITCN